jgi:caffeoyl-CoA O-methyltransferase
MANRTIEIDAKLYDYLLAASLREPPLFAQLREETAKMPEAGMQISPEQGQFMGLLIEITGARHALEIGTFTGYSALCIASSLPEDGMLVACDMSAEWTAMGWRYWKEAGIEHKIDLRIGPGLTTLDGLIAQGRASSFDFAFIDADKGNYDGYYERALALLRPGGLITIDNVLWSGKVADTSADDPDTRAIRAINAKIKEDTRVTSSLVPIGDGLMLARKRG